VAADIIPFIGGVFAEHYEWPEQDELINASNITWH
jgi:hypothetical protein